MSHPLLEDYKLYKNIVEDSSQNTRIDAVLYSVTDFLKSAFGIPILQEDMTETLSTIRNKLVLKYLPQEITSLSFDDVGWDLSKIYTQGNVVEGLEEPFPNGIKNATISYKIGYLVDSSNNEIPYDLRMATFILTARLLESANNSGESVDYMSDPLGGRFKILQQIPPEFYMLIAPYRNYII